MMNQSFITPGFGEDQDQEIRLDRDEEEEEDINLLKQIAQREFAQKQTYEYHKGNNDNEYDPFNTGNICNTLFFNNHEDMMTPGEPFFYDFNKPQLQNISSLCQFQDVPLDHTTYEERSNIDPQVYLKQHSDYDFNVNDEDEQNETLQDHLQSSIFEQMQPQQQDHSIALQSNHSFLIDDDQIIGNEDLFVQKQIEQSSSQQIRKRRGAPFKGTVSDNKEEKFKVQRQQILRDFKTYYEKQQYLKRYSNHTQRKKKKVFSSNNELEQFLRQTTNEDAHLLFENNLFQFIEENSRHYNKIRGDFGLIREPMYQYRKEVKERLFQDNYMAFYWMHYRYFGEFQNYNNDKGQEIRVILTDFDDIAMKTLDNGNLILKAYILQLLGQIHGYVQEITPQGNFDVQDTPGQFDDIITPGQGQEVSTAEDKSQIQDKDGVC